MQPYNTCASTHTHTLTNTDKTIALLPSLDAIHPFPAGNADLPHFLKAIEEYAGINYEGRGCKYACTHRHKRKHEHTHSQVY